MRPQVVLVYGDTNSTLAGALAAAKLNVPIAHVEAGLRSFDRRMPEEVNRVLTDHLSSLLFCPTDTAVANLRREGIVAGVVQTGDVMFDLAMTTLSREREDGCARALRRAARRLRAGDRAPAGHRRRPAHLAPSSALSAPCPRPSIFPAHPRTAAAHRSLRPGRARHAQHRLSGPVGYVESLALAKNARVVATDSGGLQKEAYFFGVPCVTMRDSSEWVETIESGWNVLVGTDPEALAAALADPPRGAQHPAFYGRGDAGERLAPPSARSWPQTAVGAGLPDRASNH